MGERKNEPAQRRQRRRFEAPAWLWAALLLGLAWGCGDDDGTGPGTDAGVADAGIEVDAGPPDAGPPPIDDICTDMDLPRRNFAPGTGGNLFGDTAGDFTVNTLGGTWTLSENYTGCESYVFLTDLRELVSPQGRPQLAAYWDNGAAEQVLVRGPQNVQYFFVSMSETPEARQQAAEQVRANMEEGFEYLVDWTDEQKQAARERMHFVTDRLIDIEGSVGVFARDYFNYMPESAVDLGDRGMAQAPAPFAFAIDREQRWDSGGGMTTTVGGPMRFYMASYLGHFFNHKAALASRLAAEDATIIPLVEGSVTERIFTQEVTIPALDAFDTLEVEVRVHCPHRNVFGCSEWDRLAHVHVCTNEDCSERTELVRWITPYWRRGTRHWTIDASALMGLLEPGMQSFRIEMGPEWERATERDVRVALRLSNRGGERFEGAEFAFGGGDFNENYNADREAMTFAPPADASKVELVVILSGHGQAEGSNCAEWCDHRHVFQLNGTDLDEIAHEGRIGSSDGCASAAALGASPGQYGNWAPERAYWCPGVPVEAMRIDITEQVNLGETNTLNYRGNYRGSETLGGGSISLSSYVVWR